MSAVCYMLDPVSGAAFASRMSRDTMVFRLTDALPQAPHLADLAGVVPDQLAYVVLPPRARFPFIPADERRAILFIVGDDAGLAAGPGAFHRRTLRRILGRAVFIGIVPGAPVRTFYGHAIRIAVERKGWSVLVETQPQKREAWVRFAIRHARVSVELTQP